MSAVEHDLDFSDEIAQLQVAGWRTEQFQALGFSVPDATYLGCMTEVHHLYAKRLLDNGCSHSQAMEILR